MPPDAARDYSTIYTESCLTSVSSIASMTRLWLLRLRPHDDDAVRRIAAN